MFKYWKIVIPILLTLATILIVAQYNRTTSIKHFSFSNSANDSLEGYFKRAERLAKQNLSQFSTATFLAVGDIMLSRNVALAIQKSADVNLPFFKMASILKSTDFNFGNLESPIVKNGTVGGHSMIFATPEKYAVGLKEYNFKILNLANNHALDQDLNGINSTIATLDTLNINHIGAEKSLDKAWQSAIVEANGIKICFVGASYASINDSGKTKNNYVARIEDLENLKFAIEKTKAECDFTVATMHAGTEYTRKPNKAQMNYPAASSGVSPLLRHWSLKQS